MTKSIFEMISTNNKLKENLSHLKNKNKLLDQNMENLLTILNQENKQKEEICNCLLYEIMTFLSFFIFHVLASELQDLTTQRFQKLNANEKVQMGDEKMEMLKHEE